MDQLPLLGKVSPAIELAAPLDSERVWGVDYGKGNFHICPSDAEITEDGPELSYYSTKSADHFLELNFCRPGDRVAVEVAHLTPRAETTLVSRAQPYSYKELLRLAETAQRKGVEIRLWPQGQTPRARTRFYGHIAEDDRKTDAIDCHSIALAASHFGFERLQSFKPRPSGEWDELEQWAFKQKEDMNQMCRYWMGEHDRVRLPGIEKLLGHSGRRLRMEMEIRSAALDETLKRDCQTYFIGGKCIGEKATSEANGALALWSAIVNQHGELRLFKGKKLGINNTMRYLLGNKPCHFRAGVARSNLWYHKFRAMLRAEGVIDKKNQKQVPTDPSDPRYQKFVECKRRYRKAMKATLKLMRECVAMSP